MLYGMLCSEEFEQRATVFLLAYLIIIPKIPAIKATPIIIKIGKSFICVATEREVI